MATLITTCPACREPAQLLDDGTVVCDDGDERHVMTASEAADLAQFRELADQIATIAASPGGQHQRDARIRTALADYERARQVAS